MRNAVRLAGLGTVAAYGAYCAPAATFATSIRRWTPTLTGRGNPDHVALTFDDGPDPLGTPRILDELQELDVRATFFLLGEMVERSPAIAARIASEGHEIALHGWHHRNSMRVTPWSLRRSLAGAIDLIQDVTGVRPALYRPPYGVLTLGTLWAAASLDLTTVLWGAWGKDWSVTATPWTVLRCLEPDLRPGATVLLHDSDCTSSPGSWRSTLGALRPLVEGLHARQLSVGPLRDHHLAGAAGRLGRHES